LPLAELTVVRVFGVFGDQAVQAFFKDSSKAAQAAGKLLR
jgi:hypothetical protein